MRDLLKMEITRDLLRKGHKVTWFDCESGAKSVCPYCKRKAVIQNKDLYSAALPYAFGSALDTRCKSPLFGIDLIQKQEMDDYS